MPQSSTQLHAPTTQADLAHLRSSVTVRRYMIDDPVAAITRLLHRAYAPQAAMGLSPLAGRQDEKTTLGRVLASECFLATLPGLNDRDHIVGVILFNEHERVAFPEFFLRPGIAHFAMFGVDPASQGLGVGRLLLDHCEQHARDTGFSELALSMAEPDTRLRDYYDTRGYRFIEHWQWPYTNYTSCILSKGVA